MKVITGKFVRLEFYERESVPLRNATTGLSCPAGKLYYGVIDELDGKTWLFTEDGWTLQLLIGVKVSITEMED